MSSSSSSSSRFLEHSLSSLSSSSLSSTTTIAVAAPPPPAIAASLSIDDRSTRKSIKASSEILRTTLSVLGLVLSLYALYVEHRMAEQEEHRQQQQQHGSAGLSSADIEGILRAGGGEGGGEEAYEEEEFKALCDIESIGASCSKTFMLPVGRLISYFGVVPEGHVLDVPNAFLGVVYYSYQTFLYNVLFRTRSTRWIIPSMALTSSIFLAYQLTFVLKELCLLCWSTHIINVSLWYQSVFAATSSMSLADDSSNVDSDNATTARKTVGTRTTKSASAAAPVLKPKVY